MTYLWIALLLGVIAGLRAMTPLAAVSWGAHLGLIVPAGWLGVLGYAWTPWILTVLALAELVTDQLPSTPSRKVPVQFGTRLVSGAVCGAAVGGAEGLWFGATLGAIGAVLGTLGGAAVRARLATTFGRDLPAALLEDLVAVGGAALLVAAA